MKKVLCLAGASALTISAHAVVLPTNGHFNNNLVPFGNNQTVTMHQVFASGLFGASPVNISSIGFSPAENGPYTFNLTVRFGITNAVPGVASGGGGLAIPTLGGGGGPNAVGSMSLFYLNPAHNINIAAATSSGTNFSEFRLNGSFDYNPSAGNLLLEIVCETGANFLDMAVSRSLGSPESSRAYTSSRFGSAETPGEAIRVDFNFAAVPEPASMGALSLGALALIARRRRR